MDVNGLQALKLGVQGELAFVLSILARAIRARCNKKYDAAVASRSVKNQRKLFAMHKSTNRPGVLITHQLPYEFEPALGVDGKVL